MIFEKDSKVLSIEEFERLTGAKWIEKLEFESEKIFKDIVKTSQKLYNKGEMSLEQRWLGKYFKNEILAPFKPDVAIRFIDPILGWGVFTMRPFKKMEFIAEYTGKVRKRTKADEKNAYCFEYAVVNGYRTGYNIDGMEQGGLSRYINHSSTPNLNSSLATIEDVAHVVLYTKEPIAKGEQLCYDYGPNYWSRRTKPIDL